MYWSSTTRTAKPNFAFRLSMIDGTYNHQALKTAPEPIWPVMGGLLPFPVPEYPANVWQTGQTTGFHQGDDGYLQVGVIIPSPRFIDNSDGTVTDRLTGLMWLKDVSCLGSVNWATAFEQLNDLNENPANYSSICEEYTATHDDWRLPNRKEQFSLIDRSQEQPALELGHPFVDMHSFSAYWSSTTNVALTGSAHYTEFWFGNQSSAVKTGGLLCWPVRGGRSFDGDFDGDGDVDAYDLAVFIEEFGRTDCGIGDPCECDLDHDGDVDEDDLAIFVADFGESN
jgi:hypothetical protein